jgi:uncharacterized protein YprB with RNaseH-like and TPR domain
MSILDHTFIHIHGYKTPEKEQGLWDQGILTHESLLRSGLVNKSAKARDWIEETIGALDRNDHDFFAERLPKNFHYRLAMAYPRETVFLDIETTGLSSQYSDITIVGWAMDDKFKVMVNGRDDPGEFHRDLSRAKAIVTFNGTSFDIPFLNRAFSSLQIPKAHADLRHMCRRAGLTGGQKYIEQQIGLNRGLGTGNGARAVELWWSYKSRARSRANRINALRELIIYNYADVNAMKYILDHLLESMAREGKFPCPIDTPFKSLSAPMDFEDPFPFSLEPF